MMNSKDKALQQLKIAEHLLNITFPLVKDPKLLIGIIRNLNSCLDYAMESVFPENLAVPKSLNGRINHLHNEHNTPKKYTDLILKINQLVTLHEESPVVFKRGNRQVICNKDYDIEVISANEVENLIRLTKEFLSHSEVL